MSNNRGQYKRCAKLGPGGMDCACCGPAPGKDRKRAKRVWKRRERRKAMKEARREAFHEHLA